MTMTAPRLLVPINKITARMQRKRVSHRLVRRPAASATAGAWAKRSHRRQSKAHSEPAASRIGELIAICCGVMVTSMPVNMFCISITCSPLWAMMRNESDRPPM